ncbi:hypothetical protein EYF80_038792 [Liparis tanakae]|uniref:Uncharacterized protein n=1 Tax=Liparis tanakae TaxID=230148 RepID=A0A4Z2GCK5_9TELE|nr:hypothetical protein EYF80_038792 [Liparis tanakae]
MSSEEQSGVIKPRSHAPGRGTREEEGPPGRRKGHQGGDKVTREEEGPPGRRRGRSGGDRATKEEEGPPGRRRGHQGGDKVTREETRSPGRRQGHQGGGGATREEEGPPGRRRGHQAWFHSHEDAHALIYPSAPLGDFKDEFNYHENEKSTRPVKHNARDVIIKDTLVHYDVTEDETGEEQMQREHAPLRTRDGNPAGRESRSPQPRVRFPPPAS